MMKDWRVAWAILGSVLLVNQMAGTELRVQHMEPQIWQVDFTSHALGRDMRFTVVLPADSEMTVPKLPVVYVLHGRGRDETTLLMDDFCRRHLLALRCAVVLPRGLDGWYINSLARPDDRFASYVDEVMQLAEQNFPLRADAAGRAIAGWSMGGYGAAYTFVRRADDFAALATIIGIIDYPRRTISPPDQNYPVQPCFGGDPEQWLPLNPRLKLERGRAKPMLIAYAEDAPEREMNEAFLATARERGWSPRELRLPGKHEFSVVREAIPAVLGFLELQLMPAGPAPSFPEHAR